MKKKILSLLLATVLLLSSFPLIGIVNLASAAEVEVGQYYDVDGFVYHVLTSDRDTKEGTVNLMGPRNNNITGDVEIPSYVDLRGYTLEVVEIYHRAFMWCSHLQNVYIPETVTRIGMLAFLNVKEVIFENPDTLQLLFTNSIKRYKKSNCAEITINKNNSSKDSSVSLEIVGYKNGLTNDEKVFRPGQLLTTQLDGYTGNEDIWYQFTVNENTDAGNYLSFPSADMTITGTDLFDPSGYASTLLCKGEIYASLPYMYPYWACISSIVDAKTLCAHAYVMGYDSNGFPLFNEIAKKKVDIKSYNRGGVVKKADDASKFFKRELKDNVLIMASGETVTFAQLLARSGNPEMTGGYVKCNKYELSAYSGTTQTVQLGAGSGENIQFVAGEEEGITKVDYKVSSEGLQELVVAAFKFHGNAFENDITGGSNDDKHLHEMAVAQLQGSAHHGDAEFKTTNYVYVAPKFEYNATYNSISFEDKTSTPGVNSSYTIAANAKYSQEGKTITYSGLRANTTYTITQTVTFNLDGQEVSGQIIHQVKTEDGYPMIFNAISDDPSWASNAVYITYEDGSICSAMRVSGYDNDTGARSYKAIIPSDPEDNLQNYRITVDGVDVGVTMRQVEGEDVSSAEFYTTKVKLTQDGEPKTDGVITMQGAGRTLCVSDCTEDGVYTQHFLKNNKNYSVEVSNVIDTKTYTVNKNKPELTIDYYTVNFITSTESETNNDVIYNNKQFRAYTVAEGEMVKTPSSPNLNGYTFSTWNETPFAEGESKEQASFDYTTPITQTTNLYAHFIKAAIEMNEIVKCDEDGSVNGEGKSYRMPNLSVIGFSKGKVLRSMRLSFTGITKVSLPQIEGAEILTKSGEIPNIVDDCYVFTTDDNVVFNLTDKVSCADMESYLRNFVVTPNATKDSSMMVTVSDNVQSPYETTPEKQTAASVSWQCVNSYKSTFTSGNYYFPYNVQYSSTTISGNVTFYIPANVTVGFISSETGRAGIRLYSGNSLTVLGYGTLYAKGGTGGTGGKGANGTGGTGSDDLNYICGGDGGAGGNGGQGAGAGIGTDGGSGGAGGAGSAHYPQAHEDNAGNQDKTPDYATSGQAGNSASAMGYLYAASTVIVDAHGGAAGNAGEGGEGGISNIFTRKGNDSSTLYYFGSGGGGGGGGGGGYPAADIGTGGRGGAGGGGGRGGLNSRARDDGYYVRQSKGGSGGDGGNKGRSGGDATYGSIKINKEVKTFDGAAGGSSSNSASGGSKQSADNSSINCSVTYDATAVGGKKSSVTYEPFLVSGTKLSFPGYTAPTGLQFNGWRVVNYGKYITGQSQYSEATYASSKLFDIDEQYILTDRVCGSMVYKPDVEPIKAKTASASHLVKQSEFAEVVDYYTYTVNTILDGEDKDLGKLTFVNSEDPLDLFNLNGTEDGLYTAILSKNVTYKLYLNGMDTGVTVDSENPAIIEMKSLHVDVTANGEKDYENHLIQLFNGMEFVECDAVYYEEKFTAGYELYVLSDMAMDSYEIYIDNEDSGQQVVPSGSETVNLIRATVTVNGNSEINEVRILADDGGYVLTQQDDGTFTYTTLHESDTVYKVYVNRLDSGKTLSLTNTQSKAEATLYTVDVQVNVDGVAYDNEDYAPIYNDLTGKKLGTGSYELYQFDELAPVDVGGTVHTATEVENENRVGGVGYLATYEFYSITVAEGVVNGTVFGDVEVAAAGDYVTIDATPDADYCTTSITAKQKDGTLIFECDGTVTGSLAELVAANAAAAEETAAEEATAEDEDVSLDDVDVIDESQNTSFTMPATPVIISAEFEKHEHVWLFRIGDENNIVRATCTFPGCSQSPCDVCVSKDDHVYESNRIPKPATVTVTKTEDEEVISSIPDVATPEVVYYTADNEKLDGVPVDAGDYKATISYTGFSIMNSKVPEITTVTAVKEYTIIEADTKILTIPEALDLTYNATSTTLATPQTLAAAGTAENGIMYYAVNQDAENAPDASEFTTTVPTQTYVGIYYVWYQSIGVKNYNDTEPACIETQIKRRNPVASDFTFTPNSNLYYDITSKDASIVTLPDIVGMGDFEIQYFSDAACTQRVNPINVGTYYVGIDISEGDNYNAAFVTDASWKFEIVYRPIEITFDKGEDRATGTMDKLNMYAYHADLVPLTKNAYSYGTRDFRGWSLTPYGTPLYHDGDEISLIPDSMTLYAVWGYVVPTDEQEEKLDKSLEALIDEGVGAEKGDGVDPAVIKSATPEEQRKYNVTGVVDALKDDVLDQLVNDNIHSDYHTQNLEIDITNRVVLEDAVLEKGKITELDYSVTPYVQVTTYVDEEVVRASKPRKVENNEFKLDPEFTVSLSCCDMVPLSIVHSEKNELGVDVIIDIITGDDMNYDTTNDTVTVTIQQFSDIKIYDHIVEWPEAQLIRHGLVVDSGKLDYIMAEVQGQPEENEEDKETIRIRNTCNYEDLVYCYAPEDYDGTPLQFYVDFNNKEVNAEFAEKNGYLLGYEPTDDEQITKYTIFAGCRNITYEAYHYMGIRLQKAVGVKDGFRMYKLDNTFIAGENGLKGTQSYEQTECHPVRFTVEKLAGCTFEYYSVIVNDIVIYPDGDGVYTIEPGEEDVVVVVKGTPEEVEEKELSLWEKIYKKFRSIVQYVLSWFKWGSHSASDNVADSANDSAGTVKGSVG